MKVTVNSSPSPQKIKTADACHERRYNS